MPLQSCKFIGDICTDYCITVVTIITMDIIIVILFNKKFMHLSFISVGVFVFECIVSYWFSFYIVIAALSLAIISYVIRFATPF